MEHNLHHFVKPIKRTELAELLGKQQANSVIFELRKDSQVELKNGYFLLTRRGRVRYERYLGVKPGAQGKVTCGDCAGCNPGYCRKVFQ